LLGDRIRMNAIETDKIFMRSMPPAITARKLRRRCRRCIGCLQGQRFCLIVVDNLRLRPGLSAIVPLADTLVLCHNSRIRRASGGSWRKSTCSISADRRHQQISTQMLRGSLRATCASSKPAQPMNGLAKSPETRPVVRHHGLALQRRRRSPRSTCLLPRAPCRRRA